MTLEAALAANTAALNAQTEAIRSLLACWDNLRTQAIKLSNEGHTPASLTVAGVPMAEAPAAAQDTAAPATKVAKAKADPKPAPTPAADEPAQTEVATDATASDSPSDEVPEVSIDEVSAAITKYVTAHRPIVVGTLAEFGAKRGSEIPPEKRGEFLRVLAEKVGDQ